LPLGTHTITFESTDDEGNDSTCRFELTVVEILSIQDANLKEGLSISPNPASDMINIISANINLTDISIVDISGKLLFSLSNLDTERRTINISTLAQGIYFVQVNDEVTKKIVKK
jgi:hypothetical protein